MKKISKIFKEIVWFFLSLIQVWTSKKNGYQEPYSHHYFMNTVPCSLVLTNKETDSWRDGQMDRWTDGQMERWTDGQINRWTDWQTNRWTDWQTGRQTDGQTDRLTD
jgi:hypothetical protein